MNTNTKALRKIHGSVQVAPKTFSEFRIAWAMQLAGAAHDDIAETLGCTVPQIRAILKSGDEHLTYGRSDELDLGELRRIELSRLDEIQRAHWATATGRFVRDYVDELPARLGVETTEELRNEVASVLPRLIVESQRAAKIVLEVMGRRSALLGLAAQPVDGADVMPVVVFTAPRPQRIGAIVAAAIDPPA